jgi:Nitrous oxide-stimulated promoter
MGILGKRLRREFLTLERMVHLYCGAHHAAGGGEACPQCRRFLDYAAERLAKCPYGEDKPTCANCPVHCYRRSQRELAREIMGYAGPRMPWRHPWLALRHLADGRRRVPAPLALRRARRTRAGQAPP